MLYLFIQIQYINVYSQLNKHNSKLGICTNVNHSRFVTSDVLNMLYALLLYVSLYAVMKFVNRIYSLTIAFNSIVQTQFFVIQIVNKWMESTRMFSWWWGYGSFSFEITRIYALLVRLFTSYTCTVDYNLIDLGNFTLLNAFHSINYSKSFE